MVGRVLSSTSSPATAAASLPARFFPGSALPDSAFSESVLSRPDLVRASGSRCFTSRRMPTSTVAAVVPAMTGKLLMRGVPIASALDSMSLPSGNPDAVSTMSGTASAIASGGCTIGPKRLFRWTARTAPRAPTT